jgi:hypothetical protein
LHGDGIASVDVQGSVGTDIAGSGVSSEDADRRLVLEGQCVIRVLEENDRVGSVTASESAVVSTNVDMGCRLDVVRVAFILAELEVSHEVSDDHVVQASLGKAAVVQGGGHRRITPQARRAIVHASVGRVDVTLLATNICVNNTGEADFHLQVLSEGGLALALEYGEHFQVVNPSDLCLPKSRSC